MKSNVLNKTEPALKSTPNHKPDATGVIAVTRAISLLESFGVQDEYLSLAELSRRSGLHKTTVLRIARTLATHQYLVYRDDGAWRLGPAAGWLGARYQASFDVTASVEPVLQELSKLSGESSTFFVREGNTRTCLYRVEGPQAIRFHIRVGQVLPLEKGSPGKVILAFTGTPGSEFDGIRRKGYYISIGERDADVASVSAPVYGVNWQLLGAISISGPASRLTKKKLEAFVETLVGKANQLSITLGGKRGANLSGLKESRWHP
ncbi:IclR family transcriptional regulator [Paralcaligenes ureilyticus]|uniref:IclR family transcriptional regulator n=1 Tax=Paralcaligenes ureilyticus TaxID=627131 RepID=A0A4R3LXQ3_9BURK|nr:IclR family transcriptional regulator [Paralcaligenes ureilyticus]